MDERGPAIKRSELERLKFVIVTELSEELATEIVNEPSVGVNLFADAYCKGIMLQVRYELLGHEMERIEVRYPEDWWQALKERWFPKWALRRWPVKEEVVQLVARELYPKVKLPDKGPVVALKYE